MPLQLKKGFNSKDYMVAAAKRRVNDDPLVTQAESKLEQDATLFLESYAPAMSPHFNSGLPLSSTSMRNFLKDSKFYIGSMATQSNQLEEEIRQMSKSNFALLDDIQREALALDTDTTEEEIKVRSRFTQVHYNTFSRARDMGRDFADKDWLVDFKSGSSFLSGNIARVLGGVGITLPVRENVDVPIVEATVVGEQTDVGDTQFPIASSPAVNLLLPDRIFRHVILRKEYDNTSRLYNHTPSYCTILLTFASVQLVNLLRVRPVGQSTVYVDELSYLNESGEEVTLNQIELSGEVATTYLFEPVRTRYLKIKFKQYAPITKLVHNTGDIRVKKINEMLRGAGWSTLLTEGGEDIQGRIYDFSLESISAGLHVYESTGCFRSRVVPTKGPLALTLSKTVETIQVSNSNRTYGTQYYLNEGEVLTEHYIGVDLKSKQGTVALQELIPIPDSYPTQREFLPLFSGQARVKLFPSMQWNLDKLRVATATYSAPSWTVTTYDAHGLTAVGTQTETSFILVGPDGHAFNTYSTSWSVVDDYTLIITPYVVSGDTTALDEGEVPYPYIYLDEEQAAPLTVSKEDTALTVGDDYHISFDNGGTWWSTWPRGRDWVEIQDKAYAGACYIKILNPESSKFYWIDYRPMTNQWLTRTKMARLRSGRVVFDKSLRNSRGAFTTVIVSRADSLNPYLTPVILSYALKVREYVS